MDKKIKIGSYIEKNISYEIYFDTNVIEHINKHQKDFTDQQEFDYHFKNISQVVNNPDYIGEHPVTKSIEFIKKDKERNILVAVRGKNNRLWVKTMYPIANEKLQYYLKTNRIKPQQQENQKEEIKNSEFEKIIEAYLAKERNKICYCESIAVSVENIEKTAQQNLKGCKNENLKTILNRIIAETSQFTDKLQKIDFKVEKDGSVNIKNIAKQVREVRENIQKGVREQKQGMER